MILSLMRQLNPNVTFKRVTLRCNFAVYSIVTINAAKIEWALIFELNMVDRHREIKLEHAVLLTTDILCHRLLKMILLAE